MCQYDHDRLLQAQQRCLDCYIEAIGVNNATEVHYRQAYVASDLPNEVRSVAIRLSDFLKGTQLLLQSQWYVCWLNCCQEMGTARGSQHDAHIL
jgi:hypothetical protein